VRRLTNLTGLGLGGAHFANWSPDGRKVVFNSFWGGLPKRDIYVIDIDGAGLTKLTQDPDPLVPIDDTRPDWSPDGSRIAFQSNRTGNNEIFLMNPDGTDVLQLTSHAATDAAPEWSPDGERIAFQSNRDGNDDIWVMNADGSGLVQLTDNDVRDAKPSWSRDGKRIAFHRDVAYLGEVHGELFTMNADGTDVRMLSVPSYQGFHGFPSWSQGHDAVP
jgi:TolB protein